MRYYKLSQSLIDKYGEKTYKLPLNIPGSCPNRDGKLSYGGCSFCGEEGVGYELLDIKNSLAQQLSQNRAYIGKAYCAKKFIAYFQNYTATYRSSQELLELMEQCLFDGLVEISLSTRPDCLPQPMLEKIKEFSLENKIEVTIELGVQCLDDKILRAMNRGHDSSSSLDAMRRVKDQGLGLGIHLILNYPGMGREDAKMLAESLSELEVDRVKLHSLYVEKNTALARDYSEGRFEICSVEEYFERVLLFLGYLKEDIAVERFFARAPEEATLFCNWSRSWRYLMGELDKLMEERDFYQSMYRR